MNDADCEAMSALLLLQVTSTASETTINTSNCVTTMNANSSTSVGAAHNTISYFLATKMNPPEATSRD